MVIRVEAKVRVERKCEAYMWMQGRWNRPGRAAEKRTILDASCDLCSCEKGASTQMKWRQIAFVHLWWIAGTGWFFQLRKLGRSCVVCGKGQGTAELKILWCSWRRSQININFGNNGRPFGSKLLEPFGILWGTGHIDSNSIESSC